MLLWLLFVYGALSLVLIVLVSLSLLLSGGGMAVMSSWFDLTCWWLCWVWCLECLDFCFGGLVGFVGCLLRLTFVCFAVGILLFLVMHIVVCVLSGCSFGGFWRVVRGL